MSREYRHIYTNSKRRTAKNVGRKAQPLSRETEMAYSFCEAWRTGVNAKGPGI